MSPDEATRIATPHLDAFGRFDEWARRAALGDPAFRSRAAIEETAFATIRADEDILDAWIVRHGTEDRILALHDHDGPPAPPHWIALRQSIPDGVRVGRIQAGDPPRDAVLLAREDRGPDGARIEVSVAFLTLR